MILKKIFEMMLGFFVNEWKNFEKLGMLEKIEQFEVLEKCL